MIIKAIKETFKEICWLHVGYVCMIFFLGMIYANKQSIIISLLAGMCAIQAERELAKKIKKSYNKAEASADIPGHGPIL